MSAGPLSATFRLVPLPAQPFRSLFDCSDEALAAVGASRVVATHSPGFPCRVSLDDAAPGEEVLLLNWAHHAVDSPYRATGPIYVRRGAVEAHIAPGELPPVITRRRISVRAYDARGHMVGAEVCEGGEVRGTLERQFADPAVAYVHLHNAGPGCFACAVERVGQAVTGAPPGATS